MKKIILTALICLIQFNLAGCDYRAIESMPMVVGLAIDPIAEGYRLTAKVVIPSSNSAQGTVSGEEYIQSSGKTIFDAVRDFVMKEGQKVFWGQLDFTIINETITEEDITKILDFFARDNEVRDDMWLLVSKKDEKAEDVLKATSSEFGVKLYVIDAMNSMEEVGKYNRIKLLEFMNTYDEKGKEPVLPIASIEKSLGKDKVIINGGAVFKDNKSVGCLNGIEMQQFNLLMGEIPGIYVIDYKNTTDKSKVSLELGKVKSKIEIKKKVGGYDVTFKVTIKAEIGEITNNKVKLSNNKEIDDFKKQVEKQLEVELTEFIKKVQKDYGGDIFGIGEKVKNKDPKAFRTMDDHWNDVFTTLNIKVDTNLEISGSALYKQPLHGVE